MTKDEAEEWMYEFCASIDEEYSTIMNAAYNYLKYGDYYLGQENDEGYYGKFEGMGVPKKFWDAYEVITGSPLDKDQKEGSFFSCAC